MSVSLRLPAEVKKRVARLAKAQATTAHAFMLAAIEGRLQMEEAHAAFVAEANVRLAGMKKTGVGIPADALFEYFERRVVGHKAKKPAARKLK
jgi:predicted transcriptional regulator